VRIVAPFGFYGWGNIGDESTLQGFARLVARSGMGLRVSVASRDRAHTARVEPAFRYFRTDGRDPRRWWARRSAGAYVVAGGTPIMDILGEWPLCEVAPLVEAAAGEGKPMVFVGVGVEGLQQTGSRAAVRDRIAPGVAHWSVRSERDRARLIEYGVPAERVTAAADLAWLLDGVSTDWGWRRLAALGVRPDRPVVGVNVTNERFVVERAPELPGRLAAALDRLVDEHEAQVVFLCNEVREGGTFDRAASERIRGLMTRGDRAWLVPNRYWTPQEMMSLIGCCRLTITMRYHFCLFAALQGVPFVALERSDKVSDLRWDMRWPYGLTLGETTASSLVEMGTEILAAGDRSGRALSARVREIRERADRNLMALAVLTGRGAPATAPSRATA
jgi:polysaccharide pyruvyl transferase WcaK-like protein